MGPHANGFINYGTDGRMIVIVVGGPRTETRRRQRRSPDEKQALYDSLNAYAGTYSLNGNELTHHVDTSWNEIWTGHDQKRFLKFDRRTAAAVRVADRGRRRSHGPCAS